MGRVVMMTIESMLIRQVLEEIGRLFPLSGRPQRGRAGAAAEVEEVQKRTTRSARVRRLRWRR